MQNSDAKTEAVIRDCLLRQDQGKVVTSTEHLEKPKGIPHYKSR